MTHFAKTIVHTQTQSLTQTHTIVENETLKNKINLSKLQTKATETIVTTKQTQHNDILKANSHVF